jgi:hypothetical protein
MVDTFNQQDKPDFSWRTKDAKLAKGGINGGKAFMFYPSEHILHLRSVNRLMGTLLFVRSLRALRLCVN